jgi:hypothetical protein
MIVAFHILAEQRIEYIVETTAIKHESSFPYNLCIAPKHNVPEATVFYPDTPETVLVLANFWARKHG